MRILPVDFAPEPSVRLIVTLQIGESQKQTDKGEQQFFARNKSKRSWTILIVVADVRSQSCERQC